MTGPSLMLDVVYCSEPHRLALRLSYRIPSSSWSAWAERLLDAGTAVLSYSGELVQ